MKSFTSDSLSHDSFVQIRQPVVSRQTIVALIRLPVTPFYNFPTENECSVFRLARFCVSREWWLGVLLLTLRCIPVQNIPVLASYFPKQEV